MEVFIGMDISLHTTNVCVVNSEGSIVQEGVSPSDASSLDSYLRVHGKSWVIKRIVFETGQLSRHMHKALQHEKWPVICIDARHAHGTLKAQRVKSDQNDARGLAQIARTGWYKVTHVKSDEATSLQVLLHGRKQIVDMRVNVQNHIRGILKTYGIKLGVTTEKSFRTCVEMVVANIDSVAAATIGSLLAVHEALLLRESSLDALCRKIANTHDVCRRLMTIPGVGVQTALSYAAEIDDPYRFKSSRDVGAHVGLTPRRYASGEIDRAGGVSKCGNAALRSLLYEAAMSMLTRSRVWCRLRAWGIRIAKRSSIKIACTAVARKLAVIMHRMWIDGTEFVYGKEVMHAA